MNKKTTNEVSPIPVKDSKVRSSQTISLCNSSNCRSLTCRSMLMIIGVSQRIKPTGRRCVVNTIIRHILFSPDTFEFGADKSPPTNDNNVVSPSHSRDVPSSQENSVEQPPIVKRSVVFSPDTKDDQETITLNNAKECSR